MMNKRLVVWLPLLLSLALALGIQFGLLISGSRPSLFSSGPPSIVDEVIGYINDRYVDTVNVQQMEQQSVALVLHRLDPFSTFIPAQELTRVQEEMEGMFEGIGIEFFLVHDTVMVISVIGGGPAERAGLQAGDQIITINDSLFSGTGITDWDVVRRLRGRKGTRVKLGIRRPGLDELMQVTIERGKIPMNSIDAAYLMDAQTGFIRISRFSENTHREFVKALEQLQQEGMKQLILDLRQNGGGLLLQATELADEFLDERKLIVYTQGRNHPRTDYRCRQQGLFEQGKLVVLVDEGSASASEIVAGAIQDWDRGLLVGRRTFGKGLVQEQLRLSDGSALRLTIARYYTPSGRSIQKPYRPVQPGDTTAQLTDSVDAAAPSFHTANGRIVYGGGGILPDVIVEHDTSQRNNRFLNQVLAAGLIPQFAYSYFQKNKSSLETYRSPEDFRKRFEVSSSQYDEFVAYAKGKIPQADVEQIRKAREDITHRIKAFIARELFSSSAYFAVLNDRDATVQQAWTLINDDSSFSAANLRR
ncbi:MAG: S41 family peptidase [Chitinophagales bacterium]|nr:S41 family peptidase [Chitinophagales bacterium]